MLCVQIDAKSAQIGAFRGNFGRKCCIFPNLKKLRGYRRSSRRRSRPSMFHVTIIFYSKDVLDPELEKMIVPCDLNNTSELSSYLENFILGKDSVENQNRIKIAKKFYDNACGEKNISNKINKILNQYKDMSRRWL